jgi:arylsulfatase A-like enzyme
MYPRAWQLAVLAVLCLAGGCTDHPSAATVRSASSGTGTGRAPVAAQRPAPSVNVVLISVDTLRADHLGCYGYDRPTSPTLDQLASEGVLFEDCTAPTSWTLPSHVSMLTGLYPSRHGVNDFDRAIDVPTLAEMLRARGYSTAAVVNSLWLNQKYGFHHGFDRYLFIQPVADREMPTAVRSEAERFLKQIGDRPFFMFLHFYDVHSDYCSLPNYEKQFVDDYSGPADGTTKQLIDASQGLVKFDERDAQHLMNLYDAGIRQFDDDLRAFVAILRDRGLLEETIFVLTADHGEEFLEHGGVLHGNTHFEEVLRIPLLLRGPGLPAGLRIAEPVSLVDVMPTLLAMLGVGTSEQLDGIDLSPTFRGSGAALPQRFIFAEANLDADNSNTRWAVRQRRFKLHFDTTSGQTRLFDLLEDPGETADVSAAEPEMRTMLMERLAEFRKPPSAGGRRSPLTDAEIEKLKSLGYLD